MASNVRPVGNSTNIPVEWEVGQDEELTDNIIRSGEVVRHDNIVGIAQLDAFVGEDNTYHTTVEIEGIANAIDPNQANEYEIGAPVYVSAPTGTSVGGRVTISPVSSEDAKVAGIVTATEELADGTQRVWFKLTPGVDGAAGGGGGGSDIDWSDIEAQDISLLGHNSVYLSGGNNVHIGMEYNSLYLDETGTYLVSTESDVTLEIGSPDSDIRFNFVDGEGVWHRITLQDILDDIDSKVKSTELNSRVPFIDVTPSSNWGKVLITEPDMVGWRKLTMGNVEGLLDKIDELEQRLEALEP